MQLNLISSQTQSLWKDEKASIEQLLELHIEELMVAASAMTVEQNNKTNNENNDDNDNKQENNEIAKEKNEQKSDHVVYIQDVTLAGIRFIYDTRIHNQIHNLSFDICNRLFIALLHYIRRSEKHWSLKPMPSNIAIISFQLFAGFL